ncbi:MAG: hypothetical protein M3237_05145 [Actinomycetota bacterium]|nr:hypothetical protein [Actinomycetota bacterium]
MGDDVAVAIAEEESAHSSVLVRDRMDDLQLGSNTTFMDRSTSAGAATSTLMVGLHGADGPPSSPGAARLVCRCERVLDPTEGHADAELEDSRVQLLARATTVTSGFGTIHVAPMPSTYRADGQATAPVICLRGTPRMSPQADPLAAANSS